MQDTSETKKMADSQIRIMLLLSVLQCVLLFQLNIPDVPSIPKNSVRSAVPLLLHEKPVTPAKEKEKTEIFNYQIKKAESLYNPIIHDAASHHNVDLTMIKAIIMAESGYNKILVSSQGAGGLMQLMPGTAKSLGVKDVFNPKENINAGVKYYKLLLNRFDGNIKLALAAYNAGARNVKKYKGVPPFEETHAYIKKVLAYQRFYKYGPEQEDDTSM